MTEFATENSGLKEARRRIKHFADSWEMELDLSDLGLDRFPIEFIEEPELIHGLNLSGNKIEELPVSMSSFSALEFLDLSGNRLLKLPETIVELRNLKKLKLSDNDLVELPENIDRLSVLETLDISRNRLTRLPDTIKNLRRLKTLDFNLNKLAEVPSSVRKFSHGKKTNILTHIRKLADQASACESPFSEVFFEHAKPHLKAIMERFHLTQIQAVIYVQFLVRFEDQSIFLREIASSLNLNSLEILPLSPEFDALERKKLLLCRRPGETGETSTYRVNPQVIESLRIGKPFVVDTYENIDIERFFEVLDQMFDQHGNNESSYETFAAEIQALINNNMTLDFCRKVKEFNLEITDLILLLRFCQRLVLCNDNSIGISDIGGIFPDPVFRKFTRAFKEGEFELTRRGFVEANEDTDYEDDFFGDSEIFLLTQTTRNDLLGELGLKLQKTFKEKEKKDNLLPYGKIVEKKMFYNKKEQERIEELFSLLQADNFKAVQKRLEEKRLRSGFVCLFSGAPGTGKTETAYQLARETSRDLLSINIADIQSRWVGDSEKNLKAVFENYRSAVKARELAGVPIPILFFNEADCIISKRLELGNSARSVDQMMNSLQNIILEEMEKLPGILIATTNLVQNMDKAFERRFLYKIEFEKPDAIVRESIWGSMLPELSAVDAGELARRFDFSGGQIENVTRRAITDYVLTGVPASFEKLLKFCKEELSAKTSAPIGFAKL